MDKPGTPETPSAENALQGSDTKYRTIFDNAGDAIFILDLQGKMLDVNQVACDRLGYTREELLRMTPMDFDSPEYAELVTERIHQLMTHKHHVFETCHVRKDGTGIPTEVSSRMIAYDGQQVIIGIARDITERRKLEEQLRQSHKMEAIGVLAGGVAHDFNNILMAIIGYGTMAQKRLADDPTSKEYVNEILKGADRAAELTRGLLAFSRKQVINPKLQDLNKIVVNMETMLRRIIGEDIELLTVLSKRDVMAIVDAGQIEQVLLNLATNARDAMPDGGHLIISTDVVNIDSSHAEMHSFENTGIHAVLTVSDSGIGMDLKTRGNIFEPFFTTKEVGKGTGLGLAIAYGIIKQHGGDINVYSEVGIGTTFRIYLPMPAEKEEQGPAPAKPVPMGNGETILIADDDANVRKVIRMYLQRYGYNTIEAENGEEAVKIFSENRHSIDLLLLDVIMPVKNGSDAYEEIKTIRPDIKAIYISGYADEIIEKRGILQVGFNLISKPIDTNVLLRKLREVLDRPPGSEF